MSFRKALGSFAKYNPVSAIPYAIGDEMDVLGVHAQENLTEYQRQQAEARRAAKQQQLQMLGTMKGPQTTPQMDARIKALEDQSKPQPLATDPYMQAQRTQLVSGGARELSSVQNRQKGYGVEGGYKNVGSVSDVYDRLGTQLAQLAQKQADVKDAKGQQAAQIRQGIADAQIAYDNSLIQAQMAIESGDAQAAQQAMAQAYAAKEQIKNNTRQFILGVGSLGVTAMTGMPSSAPKTESPASAMQSQNYNQPQQDYWNNQYESPLGVTGGEYGSSYSKMPWAAQKRR